MNGFIVVIVVMIVICVLDFILFFKVWRMTNEVHIINCNVEEINEKMTVKEGENQVMERFKWYNSDPANADKVLRSLVIDDFAKIIKKVENQALNNIKVNHNGAYISVDEYVKLQYAETKKKYEALYKSLGKEMPKDLEVLSVDDFRKFNI